MYSGDEEYGDEITSGELFDDVSENEDIENMILDLEVYFDRSYLERLAWKQLDYLWHQYFD